MNHEHQKLRKKEIQTIKNQECNFKDQQQVNENKCQSGQKKLSITSKDILANFILKKVCKYKLNQ